MAGGQKFLLISGCLIGASCAANHVQVRALAEPGASTKTGSALLAQARAQLAMGSVGLALESFRTLQQQQADNVETFQGIAECYAAMGRYDLARTNLEFALAYSPDDSRLLYELSAALAQLGDHIQAIQAHDEANRLRLAPSAAPISVKGDVTPTGVPRTGSLTVKLPALSRRTMTDRGQPSQIVTPEIMSAPAAHSPTLAKPNTEAMANLKSLARPQAEASHIPYRVVPPLPAPSAAIVSQNSSQPLSASALVAKLQTKQTAYSSAKNAKHAQRQMTASSGFEPVTANEVSLSKPDHGQHVPSAQTLSADQPRPLVATRWDVRLEPVPHLERASRGEVALITSSPEPSWTRIEMADAHSRQKPLSHFPQRPDARRAEAPKELALTSLRWVPLKGAELQNVQLLNAAHRQGLAADLRTALLNRGWRKIGIGNASTVRARTIVLYGKSRTRLAFRLAAQFHCEAQR